MRLVRTSARRLLRLHPVGSIAIRHASTSTTIPIDKPKDTKYVVPMFPYPSGTLHIGHLRNYTISDAIKRYYQLNGHRVFQPIGWDSFGLPAEDAAIQRGLQPATWTVDNIQTMKQQLEKMDCSFDWPLELSTSAPEYYVHTQRLFLKLHRRGLAYRKEAAVNWDPVAETVLANEQVDSQGRSWRSGAIVEQRLMKQWFFRITAYKEALLQGLDKLDQKWPSAVLRMQQEWIGRRPGYNVTFDIAGSNRQIEIFTTRIETIFGAQFLALAPEHPLAIEHGISANSIPEQGVLLPFKAINPASRLAGAPKHVAESIPVYVAPYVLSGYGSGAVMGVPAEDDRDRAFYALNSGTIHQEVIKEGVLSDLSGPYAGVDLLAGASHILQDLAKQKLASFKEQWRLRDWLVSRQRYWGCPIPIIHCNSCGPTPVPDADLPVVLPPVDFNGRGNPLENAKEWLNVKCPSCSKPARRETDTLDTFVDSSFYYMRYLDPQNSSEIISKEAASHLPIDVYIGGVEHAILHLLYARFIYRVLAEELFPGSSTEHEPFTTVLSQGMVHGLTQTHPDDRKRFLKAEEVEQLLLEGKQPIVSYEKMSKSKFNGVDPTALIAKYGSDAVRANILFTAPVTEVLEYDEQKIAGVRRWFSRIEQIVNVAKDIEENKDRSDPSLQTALEEAVASVQRDYDRFHLNTVVSSLMKLTKTLQSSIKANRLTGLRPASKILLQMMWPICPSFAVKSWKELCPTGPSLLESQWPVIETQSRAGTAVKYSVQLNGKHMFALDISLSPDLDGEAFRADLLGAVNLSEQGQVLAKRRGLDLENADRVIIVKGKAVNFVFRK
jgi:leucyl-tRNA synthetase